MYNVVVKKSSRSLSHLLMSFLFVFVLFNVYVFGIFGLLLFYVVSTSAIDGLGRLSPK